jgi:hypothetical protein
MLAPEMPLMRNAALQAAPYAWRTMSGASEFNSLIAIQRSRRLSATRRASSGAGYPAGSRRRVLLASIRGRKHRSGASTDQVNAIATKPEQSRTRPAMVTARKLLEANSSRMVHHLSLGNAGHRFDYRARTERPSRCTVKRISCKTPTFDRG